MVTKVVTSILTQEAAAETETHGANQEVALGSDPLS